MLLAAVRCFRARPLVDGLREGAGRCCSCCARADAAAICRSPASEVAQHGPGGLLGEWLGERSAPASSAPSARRWPPPRCWSVGVAAGHGDQPCARRRWSCGLGRAPRPARGSWSARGAAWRTARAAFPEKDDAGERAIGASRARRRSGRARPRARSRSSSRSGRAHEAEVETPRRSAPVDALRTSERGPRRRAADGVDGVVGRARGHGRHRRRGGGGRAVDDDDEAEAAERGRRRRRRRGEPTPTAGRARDSRRARHLRRPTRPSSSSRRRSRACASEARRPRRRGRRRRARRAAEKPGFIKLGDGAFALPATDLLEYIPPEGNEMDKQALYEMAERLEQAMANYGVRGKVKEIHMGPVVTMYEFAPAPGTRTGKIANLEKDLAMALEAQAVRIVAPIPGKAVVGVEVPNQTRETVYLKEILQDSCFTGASSKLQIALGKDIKGGAGQRQPVEDAAPAGRRHHRLGQVGGGERHDHQHALQRHARRGPLHHGRPQDAGALDLRGDPAPAAAGGHRPEEGEPGAALGGRRDGAPLRAAGQDGRARHRQLQRQASTRRPGARPQGGRGGQPPQDRQEDPGRHRRPRRHRAGGRPRRRHRGDRRRGGERRDGGGIVGYEAPSDEDLSDAAAAVQAAEEKAERRRASRPSSPTSSSSSTSSPTS